MFLEFRIAGKVKAKQSFKIGRNGFKYTPSDVVDYANYVKLCFMQAYPKHDPSICKDEAICFEINAYFAVPKSFSKTKQKMAMDGVLRPLVKPDCDNICKCIADALNGLAYPDDKQIVSLTVRKFYSATECVVVRILS